MHEALLDLLVDPVSRAPLHLEEAEKRRGEIASGLLCAPDGRSYPIAAGIPRFVDMVDKDQQQTGDAFAYKWGRREAYDSPRMIDTARTWLLKRYGFDDPTAMRRFFATRGRVLDAGCGSGFSASTWLDGSWAETGAQWVGADVSAAVDVAAERLGAIGGTHFVQADVAAPPFPPASFGAVFAEGVLHHTPSTEGSLRALADLLEPGGELLFYVYRRKGPVREFTDDHVRTLVADLPPEEAWDALRPLTGLGRALAELRAEVEVPEDVPLLGIPAGRYEVQRLVYWHFAKLFWNPALSFEENNHVQFDWYRPRYAHRHDEGEVRGWCDDLGLEVVRFDSEASGFTVRARRP